MKKLSVIIPLFFVSIIFGQPTNYWQQQTDFQIAVTLNDTKHTLDGFETIKYTNNSPDSLTYIWFHLWPNAFKNDKTAYSEQMVERLGSSAFYFSNDEDRGYINKLNFKVDGEVATLLDHPQYLDVAQLVLPKALAPGQSITITTPFHVQIPKNFSRGGHIGQSYQITQWYPKPALYDKTGWHAMPYLDQGEFYNDFGNYDIAISLPKNYVVAATGDLQEQVEKEFLLSRNKPLSIPVAAPVKKDIFAKKKNTNEEVPASDAAIKTIHYIAKNVVDFAWFADKRFIVQHDTISLPTNPKIDAYTFILPSKQTLWKNSISYTKRAVRYYSGQLGDYPYSSVNVVCAPNIPASGGMEYPNITLVNVTSNSETQLDIVIAHEIGHNWLQAMLATNERDHAWMDEGMNSYYENKYAILYPHAFPLTKPATKKPKETKDLDDIILVSQINQKDDQLIETTSEDLTKTNYGALTYIKAALWMQKLERTIGEEKMKAVMLAYFQQWKMKHPTPEDFKNVAETVSGQNLDAIFGLLTVKGSLEKSAPKPIKVSFVVPTFNSDERNIVVGPAFAYNSYDGAMIGGFIHNIGLPTKPFKFAVAPLYGTRSKTFDVLGAASYSFYSDSKKIHSITPSLGIAKFSNDDGEGDQYQKIYHGFLKIEPSIKIELAKSRPTSNITKWLELKSYFIKEEAFDFKQRQLPQDTFQYYAVKGKSTNRTVTQLAFGIENNRELYPYKAVLQVQQVGDLLRATVTGNYFYNYSEKQGVNIRFFAGKIFYTSPKTDKYRFANSRYHFTMYGANGDDDYTYSNPFIERNQNTNLPGKQIMIRDGGFKYRSDFSSERPGRTDDWLAATNLTFEVPNKINPLSVLPVSLPLKVFADIGTYAEGWEENNPNSKFLYSIGLQLNVLKCINVYWTIIQSNQFKAPNELNGMKWWQKNVTFSVDFQNLKPILGGVKLW